MEDSIINEITPGLYLGNIAAARDKKMLKRLGITHVVVAAENAACLYPEAFEYHRADLLDSAEVDILSHFEETFAFIDEGINQGGKVLVHW